MGNGNADVKGWVFVERMVFTDLCMVELGCGKALFSEKSLEQMNLDEDAMYVIWSMENGESKIFEISGYGNMVFVSA